MYPPTLDPAAFLDVAAVPDPPGEMPVKLAKQGYGLSQVNAVDKRFCDVLELGLINNTLGTASTASFDEVPAPLVSNDPRRFCIAPRGETVDICWKLGGHKHVRELTLELFRSGDVAPFWTKKIAWKGEAPEEGRTRFDGDLRADAFDEPDATVTPTYLGADFPADCLTIEHSPYKLRATITSAPGAIRRRIARWLYIDVLVHELEFTWGDPAWLAGAPGSVTPTNQAAAQQYEGEAFQAVTHASPKPGGATHDLELASDLFAMQARTDERAAEMADRTDFGAYRDLWGDGPRVPLRVRALVRRSNRTGVAAPLALGTARVLWDWREPDAARWQGALAAGACDHTERYFRALYEEKKGLSAPGDTVNCHASLGGKQGGGAAFFPTHDPGGPLMGKVEPAVNRPWAALSSFGAQGRGEETRAIFQPARQAGEKYEVRGYLRFARDPVDALPVASPDELATQPATFRVWRKVRVHHLERGPNRLGVAAATARSDVKVAYERELYVKLDVRPHAVQNNDWITALGAAAAIARRDAGWSRKVPALPLLLDHLLDDAPAANSAAVPFRPWNDFDTRVRDALQRGRVQRFGHLVGRAPIHRGGPSFLAEEIAATSGGARGLLLTEPYVETAPLLVLIPPNVPGFANDATVRGTASGVSGRAEVSLARSCTRHHIIPANLRGGDDDDTVVVVFPNNVPPVVVTYSHTGISRTLSTTLKPEAENSLRNAMAAASAAHDESSEFIIRVRSRQDSTNAQTRTANVQAFLRRLVAREMVVIDRELLWQQMCGTATGDLAGHPDVRWSVTSGDRWGAALKNVALALLGDAVWSYAQSVLPGERGVLLAHVPGRFTPVVCPHAIPPVEPTLSGAAYAEITGRRDTTVVYFSTPNDGTPVPGKTAGPVLCHELGHALFLPHAPQASKKELPNQVDAVHVRGDSCVMNYDVASEHFCALCMMRVRGWDWHPADASVNFVTAVEVLDRHDAPLAAPIRQYVNLPRVAHWVDGTHINDINRLSPNVRVRVRFYQKRAQAFHLQLLARGPNSRYSGNEQNHHPPFAVQYHAAAPPSSSDPVGFPDRYGDVTDATTDGQGQWTGNVVVSRAGDDRFIPAAWWDGDPTCVEAPQIVTWRALYGVRFYVPDVAATMAPWVDITTNVVGEFARHHLALLPVGEYPLVGPPDRDPNDHHGISRQVNQALAATSVPWGAGSITLDTLRPYLFSMVFLRHTMKPNPSHKVTVQHLSLGGVLAHLDVHTSALVDGSTGNAIQGNPQYLWSNVQTPTEPDEWFLQATLTELDTRNVVANQQLRWDTALGGWELANDHRVNRNATVRTVAQLNGAPPLTGDWYETSDAGALTRVKVGTVAVPAGAFGAQSSAGNQLNDRIRINLAQLRRRTRKTLVSLEISARAIGIRPDGVTLSRASAVDVNGQNQQVTRGIVLANVCRLFVPKASADQLCVLVHEMGHAMAMSPNGGKIITGWNGKVEAHATWYSYNGDHCSMGAGNVPLAKQVPPPPVGGDYGNLANAATCVMYQSPLSPASMLFCPNCGDALRREDFSDGTREL